MTSKKILIAYFSRKGRNMVGGIMTNLPIGNTKVIARDIKDLTGGTMVEIETVKPYTEDYNKMLEVAQDELTRNYRPAIKDLHIDVSSYDIIFLGYPNWWSTMPMAMFTFLESYDFSNKYIVPFCTHEGSEMGISEEHIKKLCPKAIILRGEDFLGINANTSEDKIARWVKRTLETVEGMATAAV